jgi:hypothetical protein
MSRLQKKPAAHKRGHPTLQNMNFFSFCGSFLPSWIRIRIRIPNTDTDPLARLNTDPIPAVECEVILPTLIAHLKIGSLSERACLVAYASLIMCSEFPIVWFLFQIEHD